MTRMLPLSKGCQYALCAVAILSMEPWGTVLSRQELSRRTRTSDAFLSKILQILTRAGLLHSHRGSQRGYSLARPSRKIAIGDIVEAYDGLLGHDACILDDHRLCPGEQVCAMHHQWMKVQERLASLLSGVSISAVRKTLLRRRAHKEL